MASLTRCRNQERRLGGCTKIGVNTFQVNRVTSTQTLWTQGSTARAVSVDRLCVLLTPSTAIGTGFFDFSAYIVLCPTWYYLSRSSGAHGKVFVLPGLIKCDYNEKVGVSALRANRGASTSTHCFFKLAFPFTSSYPTGTIQLELSEYIELSSTMSGEFSVYLAVSY